CGSPSDPLASWRNATQKSPTATSGALGFPLPSRWDAPPVLYVAKARPSGSPERPGEGGSRRSGQWGMTRARALHTVPWVQSVFAPRSGLLLWRPAAFPGSAFDELTFCRFEVGEISSVAVVVMRLLPVDR